jgi:hypothetical protein
LRTSSLEGRAIVRDSQDRQGTVCYKDLACTPHAFRQRSVLHPPEYWRQPPLLHLLCCCKAVAFITAELKYIEMYIYVTLGQEGSKLILVSMIDIRSVDLE